MEKVIGFDDLKVGQRVRVKGKLDGDAVKALEITMQPPEDDASISGMLESINYEKSSLRIIGRELAVPQNVEVKDLERNLVSFKNLKAQTMVTVKGKYSPPNSFVPRLIRMKEMLGLNVEKMKGTIEAIDHEKKTLRLLGFTVQASPKTIVEAL